jgi:hypothetical protein
VVRQILDCWPRHGFPEAFAQALIQEVRANPNTARFCFLESIAVAHVPSYRPGDFLAGLRASEAFR